MHDSSRRCTFSLFSNNLPLDYGHEGKWYKEKCEKTKGMFNQQFLFKKIAHKIALLTKGFVSLTNSYQGYF